jgi:hypothetical protein
MNPLEYWKPETFEISSYQFKLSERKGKSHNTSGSDNTELCTYTYNELGFRGDSINKEGFKIMSLGCSLTEGVGVNNEDTWPAHLKKLIPNAVNLNFGTGGRSNDFISRCLITYYDTVKPDLVLIMYPSLMRREIYTKDGGIEPFMPTTSWGYLNETKEGQKTQESLTYLQNNNEDIINWFKNHQLIKYFLESKKCNWIWNGGELPVEYFEDNRFDGDYNKFIDLGVDGKHPGPLHNKKYASGLLNFIETKFPTYLIF